MKLIPLNVANALTTIKSFCELNLKSKGYPDCCKDCPLFIEDKDTKIDECFFGVETPDSWELE